MIPVVICDQAPPGGTIFLNSDVCICCGEPISAHEEVNIAGEITETERLYLRPFWQSLGQEAPLQ